MLKDNFAEGISETNIRCPPAQQCRGRAEAAEADEEFKDIL
jgi:hypothetical protein